MAALKRFSSILFLLFTKSLVAKIVSKQFPTEFYRKSNSANFLPKNSFSRHFWCVFETALNRHFWNLIVLNRRYCVISEWWKVIWSDVEWFEVNGRWKLKIPWWQHRVGSTPTAGIQNYSEERDVDWTCNQRLVPYCFWRGYNAEAMHPFFNIKIRHYAKKKKNGWLIMHKKMKFNF